MKTNRLIPFLGAAAVALTLGACAIEEAPDETEIFEHISNASDWASAPDFVKNSLVKVMYPGSICSGTIIDVNRILTAEHCVRDRSDKPNDFWIEFGDGSIDRVQAIKSHPSADIAVMWINQVPASSGQVPIKVHAALQGSIVSGDRVIIAGAGRTSSTGPSDAGVRRWGKIEFSTYLGDYTLNGNDGTIFSYSSGMRFEPETCVGDDPACANVCPGDSGGPVYQWRPVDGWGVIGVNSGSVCDGPNARMIAADARAWKDYITL